MKHIDLAPVKIIIIVNVIYTRWGQLVCRLISINHLRPI